MLKLLEDIPNKIVNHLGLVVDVNLHESDGYPCIEINVPASLVPISYQGTFHYRSGSTKQELKGIALQNWMLKKNGKRWEDIPVPELGIPDLDEASLKAFVGKALQKGRIPEGADKDTFDVLLETST